jgi:hypothetical protein
MQLSNLRINCNLVSGCTSIRVRGINDTSSIWNIGAQNYLVNGLSIDGTVPTTGGYIIGNNSFAGGSGAGDAVSVNNTNGYALYLRNTMVNNAGVQSTGAGLHIFGTSSSGSQHTAISQHVEKHNDGILLDGSGSVTALALNCGNGTVNCAHIKSTATGSIALINTHNNANNVAFPIILNDVTGVNLSSTFGFGTVPFYFWKNNVGEFWMDDNGLHWSPQSSLNTFTSFGGVRGAFFNNANSTANAGTGFYRMASGDTVVWRNAANTTDIPFQKQGAATGNLPADTFNIGSGGAGGLQAVFLSNTNNNMATSGALRLVNSDAIKWRNNANTNDITINSIGAAIGNIPADTLQIGINGALAGINAFFVADNSTNQATSGFIRLTNTSAVAWRNNANNADIAMSKDTSDRLHLDPFASVIMPNYIVAGGVLLISNTAPTVSSGFNGGSISSANSTAAFSVLIGTGAATNTGTVGLPTATNFWSCYAQNVSRAAVILFSASTTTSATFINQGTTFTATNWTNGDAIHVYCFGR